MHKGKFKRLALVGVLGLTGAVGAGTHKVEALTNCHLQVFSSYTSSYCTGPSNMVPYQYAQHTCNDPVFGGSWIQQGAHAPVNVSSTAGKCDSRYYYITNRTWKGTPFLN